MGSLHVSQSRRHRRGSLLYACPLQTNVELFETATLAWSDIVAYIAVVAMFSTVWRLAGPGIYRWLESREPLESGLVSGNSNMLSGSTKRINGPRRGCAKQHLLPLQSMLLVARVSVAVVVS